MTAPPRECDVTVIGGGFYGLRLAAMTARAGTSTIVCERDAHFLGRASFNNQARVHGGYHYPRSVLTAVRARQHYVRFHEDFGDAILADFTHVYAIARNQSKVRASEFVEFCRRIEAPLAPAPREIADLFDQEAVERTFIAQEAVFNAHILADQAIRHALASGVRCLPGVEVVALERGSARRLRAHWRSGAQSGTVESDWIVNATYAALNDVLVSSRLKTIPLIHELTEIAIVRPPSVMRGVGVTVMDGPFWSCVPFPALGAYSLTHVRYTPHVRWRSDDLDALSIARDAAPGTERSSHMPLMQRDAERFLPSMRDARYVKSLWETKTILPRSDADDSRPILVRHHDDAPGLISVLGGKIDSVYDVEEELRDLMLA